MRLAALTSESARVPPFRAAHPLTPHPSPRWHDQLSGKTYFDYDDPTRPIPLKGYDNGTVAYFTSLGYNITYQSPLGSSTSHAISKLPNGQWLAASDPRRPTGWGQAY